MGLALRIVPCGRCPVGGALWRCPVAVIGVGTGPAVVAERVAERGVTECGGD